MCSAPRGLCACGLMAERIASGNGDTGTSSVDIFTIIFIYLCTLKLNN